MKQYTIFLSDDQLEILPEAVKYCWTPKEKEVKFTVTEEKVIQLLTPDTKVIIEAHDDQSFFLFCRHFEYLRDRRDSRRQDLRDMNRMYVEVPDAFLLICKFYDQVPEKVLEMFAGDLCRHPFITGGSDERIMASDYFMRGNFLPEEKQQLADNLFQDLWSLRHGWRSSRAEEYKAEYREMLKALESEYITNPGTKTLTDGKF